MQCSWVNRILWNIFSIVVSVSLNVELRTQKECLILKANLYIIKFSFFCLIVQDVILCFSKFDQMCRFDHVFFSSENFFLNYSSSCVGFGLLIAFLAIYFLISYNKIQIDVQKLTTCCCWRKIHFFKKIKSVGTCRYIHK